MKKNSILAIITMVVWVNGTFAQTQEQGDSVIVSSTESVIDYKELARAIQEISLQNEKEQVQEPIVHRRTDSFSRHVHTSQRLGIAVLGGTDNDSEDTSTLKNNYNTDEDEQEAAENDGQFNEGLSLDYTFSFILGRTDKNNIFTPNKFGFSVNTGFVFAFDKQNRYGTTFDFLFKLGLETGYEHPLGLEFDFLLGTGKSCGDFIYTVVNEDGAEEDMNIPYTEWCLKRGFQLSVRSNLLHTQIKNTDIRLFVRYIDSKNPKDDAQLSKDGITNKWQEQGWSFGLLFSYHL